MSNRLETMARKALREISGQFHSGEVHETTVAAMLTLARAFAADALREVITEWNAIECGPQHKCDKLIAETLAAAEKGTT